MVGIEPTKPLCGYQLSHSAHIKVEKQLIDAPQPAYEASRFGLTSRAGLDGILQNQERRYHSFVNIFKTTLISKLSMLINLLFGGT